MEKKRRERINNSLNELKSLILGAMKKDVSGYYIICHCLYIYMNTAENKASS